MLLNILPIQIEMAPCQYLDFIFAGRRPTYSWQTDHGNNSPLYEVCRPIELFSFINKCLFQSVHVDISFLNKKTWTDLYQV